MMKRSELEKYLNTKVEITIFDGSVAKGELHKTGEEQFKYDANLYIPYNRYFLINPQSFMFRCSHVRKLKRLEVE